MLSIYESILDIVTTVSLHSLCLFVCLPFSLPVCLIIFVTKMAWQICASALRTDHVLHDWLMFCKNFSDTVKSTKFVKKVFRYTTGISRVCSANVQLLDTLWISTLLNQHARPITLLVSHSQIKWAWVCVHTLDIMYEHHNVHVQFSLALCKTIVCCCMFAMYRDDDDDGLLDAFLVADDPAFFSDEFSGPEDWGLS